MFDLVDLYLTNVVCSAGVVVLVNLPAGRRIPPALEVEVVRQHEVCFSWSARNPAHRLERGGGVAVDEGPFRAEEMAVDQDVGV